MFLQQLWIWTLTEEKIKLKKISIEITDWGSKKLHVKWGKTWNPTTGNRDYTVLDIPLNQWYYNISKLHNTRIVTKGMYHSPCGETKCSSGNQKMPCINLIFI